MAEAQTEPLSCFVRGTQTRVPKKHDDLNEMSKNSIKASAREFQMQGFRPKRLGFSRLEPAKQIGKMHVGFLTPSCRQRLMSSYDRSAWETGLIGETEGGKGALYASQRHQPPARRTRTVPGICQVQEQKRILLISSSYQLRHRARDKYCSLLLLR